MKILIYGLNYSPELIGIGKYTSEMVDWLAARGHDCRVITAQPYYPDWKVFTGYQAWKYSIETRDGVTIYRCPVWVPKQPKIFTRILHLLSFSFSSIRMLFRQRQWQPNMVICVAPSFLSAPQGLLFSKLCGAKSWLHFQDFEICAMFGAGLLKYNRVIDDAAHFMQKIITRKFDKISTISQVMCNKAERRQSNPSQIILLPNWVDTDFLSPGADRQLYRDRWGISDDTVLVLYSGNLGDKQGLGDIIAVASELKNRIDIFFAIVGNGVYRTTIMEQAQEANLKNIGFYSLQPYEMLPNLMTAADLHLVLQKRGSADAVLPSKLTGILSVGGHVIVTADPETELGQLAIRFPRIAIRIPPENFRALKNAIEDFCDSPTVVKNHNYIARKYALENLNKDLILSRFERQLQELVND